MKVTMLGCGYVGLVSGACFAEFGASVSCFDVDDTRLNKLRKAQMPIYEPGLDELVEKNVSQGRLSFLNDLDACIPGSDLVFIAVGTPARHGHADLSDVYQAVQDMAPLLKGYTVIVDKSTVPVGTARQVKKRISAVNPDADFDVASNPEFLREGAAISDFMCPDRIVIGTENTRAENVLRALYRPINVVEVPLLSTDLESAELIKYASNAFLATRISFINEISALCEEVGADVQAVAKGMGLDNRIGGKFLQPGPGYGGSCFPKDTQALVRIAEAHKVPQRLVEAVIEVNEAQKSRMIKKIQNALGGDGRGKTIAVLGLTFKPETDDMREAAALFILPGLIKNGITVHAHDPQGMDAASLLLPADVEYHEDVYSTMAGADAVVLMTEWAMYRNLDMNLVKGKLKQPVFVDLRNVYEPDKMKDLGFDYHSIGRNT